MMLNVVYYDCNFKPVNLRLVDPPFGLQLVTLILELDYLRKKPLGGTTHPLIFFQLKNIFHLLESIGSARIEENQTTLAECIEGKIEGSKNPGDYRKTNVVIGSSSHTPPDASTVPSYMEELFNFINKANPPQYDLLKVAIVHHQFVWIHPFDNGNGKVVRLLTYIMLIKYGFRVHIGGRIINPTAVFCNNRENYYRYLSLADDGSDESLLLWCEYVLNGLKNEISKIDKLLDYEFLAKNILFPAIDFALEREYITEKECKILQVAVKKQVIQAADVKRVLPDKIPAEISRNIRRLIDKKMLQAEKDSSRKYVIRFENNYLLRGIVEMLDKESFLPIPINK